MHFKKGELTCASVKGKGTWFSTGPWVTPENHGIKWSSNTSGTEQVQPHTSTTDLKDYSHLLLPMAGRSVLLSLWIYTLKKELAK